MRIVKAEQITQSVRRLCIEANCHLTDDLKNCICTCRAHEPFPVAQGILDQIIENFQIADANNVPVCQDTGMACVFVDVGQDVHVEGNLTDAIHEGVRQGYAEGYLRKSVVRDPLDRVNTGDNTPAMIYYDIVPGDQVKITVAPKGFGSENMSCLRMFTPAATREDIINYVVDAVKTAGSNPCPPMVLGIGIGGTFEQCALLAKTALCRSISEKNPDEFYSAMEAEILEKVNMLDIGPQGFGGKTTALAVAIEAGPTHIAGLPVAVNVGCHVTRHETTVI